MSPADNPAAPATAEDDTKPAPSSSEEHAAPAEAQKADATPPVKADVTHDVMKQLMDGKVEGVDLTKNEKSKAPTSEAKPIETPVETDAPVGEPSSPIELPDVRHPMDDPEDPNLDAIDGRASEKTKAGFERLRGRLRQAREDGQFGSMIIDVARTHDLDPATVAAVVGLTARARKGDQKALAELHSTLGKLGIAPPAAQLDKETLLEVEQQKVYKELFAADVAAADMSEEKARDKAKVIAEERLKNRALSQSNTQSNPPAADGQARLSPMHQAASNRVEALVAKYTEAYKKSGADFEPVFKEAQAIIAKKAEKEGPIHPTYWEYEFAQAVNQVQRKRQAPAKPAQQTNPLRPSSGAGAGGGKSGERFEAKIVGDLVSGKFDKL